MGAATSTAGGNGSQQGVQAWFLPNKKAALTKPSSSAVPPAKKLEDSTRRKQKNSIASEGRAPDGGPSPAPATPSKSALHMTHKSSKSVLHMTHMSSKSALHMTHKSSKLHKTHNGIHDDVESIVKKTHEFRKELPKGCKTLDTILRQDEMNNVVGQRGPTCAAASVANALNAVFKHDRAEEGAFKLNDVMQVYAFICERRRDEAVSKLSKLVKADASCLLVYLAKEEVCLAAKSRNKHKFDHVLLHTLPKKSCDSDAATEQVLSSVRTALETPDQPSSAFILDRVRHVVKAEWSVAKLEGRWKLASGKIAPSTAPIGNVNLGVACKSLALMREQKEVRVTSFMGMDRHCRYRVSEEDSEEEQELQWEALKAVLENKEAAVIFHLHNHYALIAGWREVQVRTSAGPTLRRQVLTARSGQAPTHWVDWEGDHHARSKKGQEIVRKSVRNTLLAWRGHGVMLVEPVKFISRQPRVDVDVRHVVEGVSLGGGEAEVAEDDDGAEEDPEAGEVGGSSDEAEP